jgi:hypothetical protein
MLGVFYAVIVLAVGVMVAALALVLRLRKVARGGRIGRVVNLLVGFILFFLIGYLVAPFTPRLPPSVAHLLTAIVFLFGAVFVVIVLRLIDALVRQVFEELEL